MAREVELKFTLEPADEAAFRGAGALAHVRPKTQQLLALYFDTPRGELAAVGMALRLRRQGRRWVQTLKAGASGTGGLHERSEWEFARRDASIDLALFAETPLAKLEDPARLHERLAEAFRVDSRRTAWLVEPAAGTRLEVVLDRGHVTANGREESILEVEVESLEGDLAEAFDLAARLFEDVALRPSTVSKAERGYRLGAHARLHPLKAPEIRLDGKATPLEAARTVIGTALAQLQANEEGVLATTDPEFVHQARIALRRLRSALRIFRDGVGVERADRWRGALGDTGRALGAARDWDVLGIEVLPPVLAAFGEAKVTRSLRRRAGRRRHLEREAARMAIRSRVHSHAILDLARWLAVTDPPPIFSEPLVDFASRLIRKRHKRLVADAARFASLSAAERHRLRIDVKRVRYSVDALASLFAEQRAKRYLEVLNALQEALGKANDAVTAARLLPALEPSESFATFARGWLAGQASGNREALDEWLARLKATPRFWRRKRDSDSAQH